MKIDFTFSRKIGTILIIVGIVATILFWSFAPYCATHICGCTGQGEEWAITQFFGYFSILIGVMCFL